MSISFKKYKINNTAKTEISFDKIDKIISNISNYYDKMNIVIYQEGGKKNINKNDKYYQKYKNLVKTSEKSIKYYKNFAQEQMSKQMQIQQYFSNLVYMLSVQRQYLLNEYLKLGNNVKNNKEKINMLETMIEGIEKYMKTPVEFENVINKIVLKGGDMSFDVFVGDITNEMDELDKHMLVIKSDKKFIETKIVDLHTRMKNIVEEQEKLFKIKTEIDWIVKELENKEEGEIMKAENYEELYKKLQTSIKAAKEGSTINKQIADYVHKLEEYAAYLENFIKANQNTIETLDTNKQALIKQQVSDVDSKQAAINAQIGGNLNGGNLVEQYNNRTTEMVIEIIKKLQQDKFTAIEVNYTDKTADILDELEFKEKNSYNLDNPPITKKNPLSDLYRQIVTLVGQLTQLDIIMKTFNILYNYFEPNIDALIHNDDIDELNIIKVWKKCFEKKNTDFYNNQILKYEILFYNSGIRTFEDALKNLVKTNQDNNIVIDIDLETNITGRNEILINKIDKTIVAMDHLVFFMYDFIWGFISLYPLAYFNLNGLEQRQFLEMLQKYITTQQNLLLRTGILTKDEIFSKIYDPDNTNLVGGDFPDNFNGYQMNQISKETIEQGKMVLYNFVSSYTANLMQSSITSTESPVPKDTSVETLMTKVNVEQMDKLSGLGRILDNLYKKINFKLGNDVSSIKSFVAVESRSKNFEELLTNLITPAASVGGAMNKPRLTPFKIALEQCSGALKPYVENINKLKYLISEKRNSKLSMEETNALFNIYTNLNGIINKGINSYMGVIPMVFFTVEYPPSLYADESDPYVFTYEQSKELVIYNKKDAENLDDTIDFHSHAAFLKSNNQNGTKKIITDPIIGLAKLLDSDNDVRKPVNNVMNIMFALGASGTGKTTRYFGFSDAPNPDDKVGIVPYIVEKALKEQKSVVIPGTKTDDRVSIAYFVCYGQYDQGKDRDKDTDEINLNELLIFFNIDEITKDSSFENSKYLPYYRDKNVYQEENDVNEYTIFYQKLMNIELKPTNFSYIKDFVMHGAKYEPIKDTRNYEYPFREILKERKGIWYNIPTSGSLSDTLTKLFEKLLNEQKKINTVLPTKNNIESSRGHTCVLIRIKDDNGKFKYFPLFDMAGTEDPEAINNFLTKNRNTENITKLIEQINKTTQIDNIIKQDKTKVSSLNELLAVPSIKNYVQSGGKGTKLVDDLLFETKQVDLGFDANDFIYKISSEGYYINHTIGMINFAAMCVGQSLQTEIDIDGNDNFDNLGTNLFKNLKNYTCLIKRDCDDESKLKLLLDNYSFKDVLKSSCIWTQIIFSFLYWNEETQESTNAYLKKAESEKIKESPYIIDMLDYFFENYTLSIEQALLCKEINVDQIMSLAEKIDKCNSMIENISIINNNSTIKIEYIEKFIQGDEGEAEELQTGIRKKSKAKYIAECNDKPTKEEKINCFEQKFNDIQEARPNITKLIKNIINSYSNEEKIPFLEKKIQETSNELKNMYFSLLKEFSSKDKCTKATLADLITKNEAQLNVDQKLKDLLTDKYYIKIDNKNAFLLKINDDENIGNFDEICKKSKDLPENSSLRMKKNDANIVNQMSRIKDSRITATKMVLMHLVTGQNYKHGMVETTIDLAENLYDATNISFESDTSSSLTESSKAISPTALSVGSHLIGGRYINYKEKYLKYRTKYLELKYN